MNGGLGRFKRGGGYLFVVAEKGVFKGWVG
jgi:hypothetical protein